MANDELPVKAFKTAKAWETWLAKHHAVSDGLWIQFAKKGSGISSVGYIEAVEVALCFGWIDGLRHALDDQYFLQRFTPRRPRSRWSKINRSKVEALIEAGRVHPAGLREVEAARSDGRWEAAYSGQASIDVPPDLAKVLAKNKAAREFFATLTARNRYAILYQIHDAKRPETRARRIAQFVEMLERHETPYAQADRRK